MNRTFVVLFVIFAVSNLSAQTPQPRLSYEDRSGTTGHTLIIDGKSFGPYKEITTVTYSTSGTAGLFLGTKRDKTYIVAQGKEAGPMPINFQPDTTYISDDGKVAAVLATSYEEESDSSETQLWVNGKLYGPFMEVYPFDYAETGGNWITTVKTGEEEFNVLVNGKTQGPFYSVETIWMAPDGKSWGYSVRNSDGALSVYTQDKKYEELQGGNFDSMYPRSAHWAYSLRTGDEEEVIVVDGKDYNGYLNFSGLSITTSGRHWGFGAEKLTSAGDYPVVVVDGKEYLGEGLSTASLGSQEFFSWSVKEGTKVTIQVLTLP